MTAQIRPRSSSGIRNLAIVFAIVGVLYLAREILIPLVFAIVLSMILAPAVGLLQKLRIGRVPSALFVFVIASCSAGAIGWVIFNDFIEVAIGLPQYRENIDRKLQAFNAPGTSALSRAADSVKELSNQLLRIPGHVNKRSGKW